MKNKNNIKILVLVIGLLILGTIATVLLQSNNNNNTSAAPGKYDDFAICLKDKGSIFYGAFWCAHCQSQKKLFGISQKLLPYIECSTPDGQSQTQICKDKKINGYPTWIFADGTQLNGEISLQQLADKTFCALP